ncbi:MAG: carboxypeptidase-like regulatory domain-containing protein, partial [Candidatus Methylomirabilales bacterium]
MRSSVVLLIPMVLTGLLTIAAPRAAAETYHGTVVDAETKAPLEGAVVVVVWHRKPIVTMNGPQYFHKAVEVLTDAAGKFAVDASPGIDWNPFTYVLKEPLIVIFMPGYGPFPWAHVKTKSVRELKEAIRTEGATIALPKLKSKEDLRKFSSIGSLLLDPLIPDDRIPNLMRLLNV